MTTGYDNMTAEDLPAVNEQGLEPEVTYEITFTLKADAYKPLEKVAEYEGRTPAEQVRRFMLEALGQRHKTASPDDASQGEARPTLTPQRMRTGNGNRRR